MNALEALAVSLLITAAGTAAVVVAPMQKERPPQYETKPPVEVALEVFPPRPRPKPTPPTTQKQVDDLTDEVAEATRTLEAIQQKLEKRAVSKESRGQK